MSFNILDISEEQQLIIELQGVWTTDCPVHHSRMKRLEITHVDFDGRDRIGELIILDEVAEGVLEIFRELYELKFPIKQIVPLEEFEGDDEKSMAANNTSAYNGRRIMYTNNWSSHAYGVAIDVNPVQNPYMLLNHDDSTIKVFPPAALDYVNRGVKKAGMVEEIVPVFAKHGFTEWGGNWEQKPDYHHFQLPWEKIQELFPGIEKPM